MLIEREYPTSPDFKAFVGEAMNEKRYRTATKLLKEALYQSSHDCKIDQELIAQANELAEILYTQADYQEAAAIYRQVSIVQQNTLRSDHPDLVESLGKLKSVLLATGCIKPNLPT